MNRSRSPWSKLFSLLAALAVALGLLAPLGSARPVGAQASPPTPLAFHPITIATTDPSAGLVSIDWLQSAGDWVAYATGARVCGGCSPALTGLHLVNTLNGRHIDIRGAMWGFSFTAGGGTTGIRQSSVLFNPPYLLWEQPGRPVPQGYNFVPGDFDCTLCLYNVDTGQGGPATALRAINPNPPSDPSALNSVVPLDLTYDGRVLVVATGATQGDHFWVVDLKTGEKTPLPFPVRAATVVQAVLLYNTNIAWIEHDPNVSEGGRLLAYTDPAAGAVQVDAQATNLQRVGSHIYWWGAPGLQHYDITSPRPAQFPVIAGATRNYAVDLGYNTDTGLGSTLAWMAPTPSSDNRTTLTVEGAGGSPPYLQAALTDRASTDEPHASVSLGGDKIAYVTYQDPTGDPRFQVQVVWLLHRDDAFGQVWTKADGPVAAGQAARTWLWGPQPFYLGMEAYANPMTNGRRMVEYYDKSRMEINNPRTYDKDKDPFYVSNGLLVAEMVSSEMRVGDTEVITARVPSTIPVAGDPRKDNPLTPGYTALAGVASLHGEHQAAARLGQPVDQTLDVNGIVGLLPAGSPLHATYAAFAPQTGHNIPDVFWPYLQGMATTYGFDWTFVTGYPITEGYWTQMRVGGHDYPVLVQAFQRRVLTYAPDFAPEWRVQQGNVGQHYFEWRYTLNGQ